MNKILDYPPLLAGLLAALAILASRYIPVATIDVPWLMWAARLIIVLGFALIFWASRSFSNSDTPIMPDQTPKAMLTEGAYKISRNPIYLGMAIILFGLALYMGSLIAFLSPVLFVLMITQRHILPEERCLKEEFGDDADIYFAKTRRWI